ncbi:MAG: hypothetical protein LUE98_00400 [Tannerellaceae bacterium]|nr:hypothetical protein [Tannerellaceae bacterium]
MTNTDHEIKNKNNWQETDTKIKDLYYWEYIREVKTLFKNFGTIDLELIANNTSQANDMNQFDFVFIDAVIRNIEDYFVQAIEAIKEEVKKENNSFLLKPGEEDKYVSLSIEKFPVYEPKITFYPGKEWLIHFQDSGFPWAEAGVMIFFNNNQVTYVEGSYDSDEMIEED